MGREDTEGRAHRRRRTLGAAVGAVLSASIASLVLGSVAEDPLPWPVRLAAIVIGMAGLAGSAMITRGLVGHARDVAAQLASARALRHSQAMYATLVSTSPDVMTLSEADSGRLVVVNDAFTRVTGWSKREAIGRRAIDLGLWAQVEQRKDLQRRLLGTETITDFQMELRTRNGEQRAMLLSAARIQRGSQNYVVVNARDMTEALRARQEREAILDSASIGIAFTRHGRLELTNPRFDAIYGWPPAALVGQPANVLWPDEADAKTFAADVSPTLRSGEVAEAERWTTRLDGTRFLVRLRGKAIDATRPGRGTIWIAEDVTGERQAELDLAQARDAAEAASRAKSAFLANTSHEIRTPLNGLLGLARLARQPDLDPLRRAHYLDQIADNAEMLATLISDILDVAKIEAGRLEIDTAPFHLRGLLDTLGQAYASLAAARGLGFTITVDPALPALVVGDSLRVRQILSNYLNNALKFTTQGAIGLHAQVLGDDVLRFEVTDSGPGITPEVGARLFTPFTQGDDSTTRRHGGTGLGLAICRELATLMHGRVGYDSEPGRGSRFWAELALPPAPDEIDEETTHSGYDLDPLQSARVLLVEDNPVNMLIAAAQLEAWGMRVEQAADGESAIAAFDAFTAAGGRFDLVLMDLQMPDMSGYETMSRLRERHGARLPPVVALTAAALVSERDRALAAGMADFLTKPLDERRVRSVLRRVIARSRA